MNQISKKEATRIFDSKLYEDWTNYEKVKFQLFQDRLAMPVPIFVEALGAVFKRPFFDSELGGNLEKLQKEFLSIQPENN